MLDEPSVPPGCGLLHHISVLLRRAFSPGLLGMLVLVAALAFCVVGYVDRAVPVVLYTESGVQRVQTQRATVGQVLADAGIAVASWDEVEPGLDTPVVPELKIVVRHARPVTLVADGTTRTVYTHHEDAAAVLAEAGLSLKSGDELWVNGQLFQAPLSPSWPDTGRARAVSTRGRPRNPVVAHLEVRRANQVVLYDGPIAQVLRTTAPTLGRALQEAGVLLYLGDRVYPDLNTPLRTGMQVRIERAMLVQVWVDGRMLRTRTHAATVAEVLSELGVSLAGQDEVVPGLEEPVQEGMQVTVERIVHELVVEEEQIPFETQWIPDPALELDHRRVETAGANGILRRRYRVIRRDGIETERLLEDEWVARDPQPYQIAYGTKIVVRTLETPEGTIEYWRRIPVFLTSYTADTCGKTPDHPTYGITRLGWEMRHGIIAVDPRVINMRSELYVPGYGRGVAADTGSLIKGRHIDLGHEVDQFVMYFKWGYVYVLTPVPPPSGIRWVLPDYPRGIF